MIDSLILPKILDCSTAGGGSFRIKQISIGQARSDLSHALLEVRAPSAEQLTEILEVVGDHGGVPTAGKDCRLVTAEFDGVFPDGFYSTTNQRTEIRWQGRWIEVQSQEIDCGVAVDPEEPSARCVPMSDVARGQQIVVGHAGVRVFPQERATGRQAFEFMTSGVSTEKPKAVAVRQIAHELFRADQQGGKTLLVGGPAIVHTGSGEHLCRLIRRGYLDLLFAGNALAAHDIELAMFGTSLGVHLDCGDIAETGHEHHLRAINQIRRVRAGRAAGTAHLGYHVRVRQERRRLRAGRQHSRRRSVAGSDHRLA